MRYPDRHQVKHRYAELQQENVNPRHYGTDDQQKNLDFIFYMIF